MRRSSSLLFLLLLFSAPLTHAQVGDGMSIGGDAYYSPVMDVVTPMIYGNVFSGSTGESAAGKSRRSSAPDLGFRYASSVSRSVRTDFLASVEQNMGAETARVLGRYYDAFGVRSLFDEAFASRGLRSDDLADVNTAYIVMMWMLANRAPMPSAADVQGIQRQVRRALLESGDVPATVRRRQRAGETLMYQTMTFLRLSELAQRSGERELLARMSDAAQGTMARQSFDMRRLVPSRNGLVVKR